MDIVVAFTVAARLIKSWLWDTQVRLLLGIAIGVVLGWLAVRGMEWGLMVDQFQDFPTGWAAVALFVFVLASFVRAYRWQVLFVGQRVPMLQLFLVQNAGIGLNNMVPVRVVSEGVQYALLTLRYKVKGGAALATLAMERILDMVVTAALLMAGLTLLPNKGEFLPYIVGALVVALASVLVIPFVIWGSGKPLLNRIPLLVSTGGFLSDLARAKVALGHGFLLTLAYWLLVGTCAWVLAQGMGLGISPFVATLAILGTLYFATALPGLPAAAGTFEFAIVYVLKFFGVEQPLAFSYGLMIHAVLFLPPIVVAIALFSAIGFASLKGRASTKPLSGGHRVAVENQSRGG